MRPADKIKNYGFTSFKKRGGREPRRVVMIRIKSTSSKEWPKNKKIWNGSKSKKKTTVD